MTQKQEPLRVIQWSTGNAGRKALAGIIRHPGLELVGVHAHSEEKVGLDAASLCEIDEPTGILATQSIEALFALGADCVCYTAQGESRIRETVDDLCRMLAAGMNVVNTAIVSLVYPPFSSPKIRKRLEEACREGGTTFLTSGFDPGWSGDIIPIALAQVCERVDQIRVSELMDYSTYEDPDFTGVFFGYGRPLDYAAPLLQPGMLKGGWGGMVLMLADAFGMKLDEIREEHERLPAPETFECAMGRIEKGTCAAVRFEVQGIIAGQPAIVAAHVNRLRDDVGSQWDRLSPGKTSGYKIEIKGSPSLTCEIEPVGEDGDHNTAGITGTAMRVVNAIPVVCDAAPGFVSVLDLPTFSYRAPARF
ncbi:MAG: dihydrodipicolinate reductase [bacterium]|nr:dihydrodipicolinate reductase [bacterium]